MTVSSTFCFLCSLPEDHLFRVDPKEICFDERPPIKYATDMDVAEILAEAIGDEGDVKLELLSKTMYLEDQETAKVKFREILSSLSPELVRMKTYIFFCLIIDGPCRWAELLSTNMEVFSRTPRSKTKPISFVFYLNMGRILTGAQEIMI